MAVSYPRLLQVIIFFCKFKLFRAQFKANSLIVIKPFFICFCRSVGERFDIPKGTLSKIFVRIINFISQLVPKYIKWPDKNEIENIKTEFARTTKFKGCIGAIDGTYVGCSAPQDQKKSYTNRKAFTSITLQAVCDAKMKYLHCYAGWPSSVPDIRIFKNSDIYLNAEEDPEPYFPNNEFILGDKAYPPLTWCVPPYIKRGRDWDITKTNFNKYHSSARQVVERSFSLLFGRFRRLKFLDLKRIDWIAPTIMVCCALHNLCMNFNEDVTEFIQEGEASRENYIIGDDGSDAQSQRSETNANREGILKRDLLRLQICNE